MSKKVTHKDKSELSFAKAVVQLFKNFITLIKDILDLAATELRLAGKSLVYIILLFVFIAVLLFSAWFSLLAALTAYFVTLHFSWAVSFLLVAGVNVLFILFAAFMMLRFCRNLTFPATRKQLNFSGVNYESFHAESEEKNS